MKPWERLHQKNLDLSRSYEMLWLSNYFSWNFILCFSSWAIRRHGLESIKHADGGEGYYRGLALPLNQQSLILWASWKRQAKKVSTLTRSPRDSRLDWLSWIFSPGHAGFQCNELANSLPSVFKYVANQLAASKPPSSLHPVSLYKDKRLGPGDRMTWTCNNRGAAGSRQN